MFVLRVIFIHIDDKINNRHNINKSTPKGVGTYAQDNQ